MKLILTPTNIALLRPTPVAAAPPALGTPTYVNHATAVNGGGAGIMTLNVPSGTADNDVLIAAFQCNTTSTITDPGGWTFLAQTTDGSNYRLRTYWKLASSEPASHNWLFSPSSTFASIMVAYRDILTSGPIDGTPTTNTGSGTTATATGLTTANNNEMLVMVSSTAGTRTYSASTLTELYDAGGPTLGYFHGLQAVAGASGNKTATISSFATWSAQLLAIKPSGGV